MKIGWVAIVALMAHICQWTFAETWYVDHSVASSGDGKSRQTAFKTIQEGIDAASNGDTVIVAEGTYLESIGLKGKNITLTSTDPLAPSVVANTVIDGNKLGSVVTFSGREDETCVLSGFTVRNGKGQYGGGVCGAPPLYMPSRATIQNNIISENSAEHWGGGLANCDGAIQNNLIVGNSAEHAGGLHGCGGVIAYNTIRENSVRGVAGGLGNCRGSIHDNMIIGNSAGWEGGAMTVCQGTIRNNTIVSNSADVGGALAECSGAIVNCIVWLNTAPNSPQLYATTTPTYSCIQGWTGGGEGNMDANPQFADSEYYLSARSPCIDTGINEDWMWVAVDLDDNPRILYGGKSLRVDMGAYEFEGKCHETLKIGRDAEGCLVLTWASMPEHTWLVWSCLDLTDGSWDEEATVLSQGETTSWTDPATGKDSQKFYRIEISQ